MLLQFTATNFRSIRDEVELSMQASDELPPTVVSRSGKIVTEAGDDLRLLRCAALYGANASGKSNLVQAIGAAQRLVVSGTSTRNQPLGLQPFRLDTDHQAKPSRFEFYVLTNGEIYGYGFAATNETIVEESLTMMIDGEEQELFSRKGRKFQFSGQLAAEPEDPKFLEFVARGTPNNQLFLYEAMLRNVESKPLTDAFHWFEQHLRIIQPSSEFTQLVELAETDPGFRQFLKQVMTWADTGVHDVTVQRRRLDDGHYVSTTTLHRRALRRAVVVDSADGGKEELSLRTHHGAESSAPAFGLEDESDGTRRLLDVAPMLHIAKRGSMVLVVDELDRSLHTSLAQQLVEMFVEHLPTTTQLVFTTHDTNLLDCHTLRPDCIWFTEKEPSGATKLFSLAEFRPEQLEMLSQDFERGYLQGRFGGIPFFGDPAKLGWTLPRNEER